MNLRRMNSVATRQLAHRLQLLHRRQGHLGLEPDAMQLSLFDHDHPPLNKDSTLPYFLVQFPGSIVPQAFQNCFQEWIATLTEPTAENSLPSASSPQKMIAIDGKAFRRSHDRNNKLGALFLVSAWSVENGVSLGQLATEEKSNEITAIPELLTNIDVSGAIVTIDAAGCQKKIATQIIDGGGDYIFSLKGNQGTLHKAIQDWFLAQMANGFLGVTVRQHQEVVTGHGRTDILTYYHCHVPTCIPGRSQWTGLRTIGVAIRESHQGDKVTREVRYFICSIRVSVKRFARAVRGHWAIENTLHWCLDVTFREDESRLRHRLAGNNVAWLKRFAISLLKQIDDKESIAMRRRMAGWNPGYLSQVLGLSRVWCAFAVSQPPTWIC
jgi:predicted transposase YbfD/YdcC